jgi:hypothetical protein
VLILFVPFHKVWAQTCNSENEKRKSHQFIYYRFQRREKERERARGSEQFPTALQKCVHHCLENNKINSGWLFRDLRFYCEQINKKTHSLRLYTRKVCECILYKILHTSNGARTTKANGFIIPFVPKNISIHKR